MKRKSEDDAVDRFARLAEALVRKEEDNTGTVRLSDRRKGGKANGKRR